jgi:RecB family endonuclease NucS
MQRQDFLDLFNRAMHANQVFVFFAHAEIHYSGRAEANLEGGDRLFIIKEDKSLIIHQPVHGNPINYLKPGAEIHIEKHEKHLHLHAKSGKDYLEVPLFRIYDVMTKKLEDGQKQTLQGNEKDMSDMIKEHPHLISKDFKPLSREEHTKFGFIDVFGHDGKGNLIIIECKRYTASLACVTQLRRYVEKIIELKGTNKVKGIMASPGISTNAKAMLEQWGFSHIAIEPPKRLERYNKQQQGLHLFLQDDDE